MTRLLFIGDIVGQPGRELVRRGLAALVAHHHIDLVIANVENAAAGFGVTPDIADDLFVVRRARDDRRQSHLGQEGDRSLLRRPAAAAAAGELPGRHAGPRRLRRARDQRRAGGGRQRDGPRVHDGASTIRFASSSTRSTAMRHEAQIMFVDFHAEATSEKVAMGWHLDGRATVVVGTHTHVQTADERVLPKGTAYITDVGMTGPHDSVIGVERSAILQRFLTGLPQRFETATENPRLNGVVVTADEIDRARALDRTAQPLGAAHRRPRRPAVRIRSRDERLAAAAVRRAGRRPRGRCSVSELTARLKAARRRRLRGASSSKARSRTAGSGARATSTSR